jgi:hypothetical protein
MRPCAGAACSGRTNPCRRLPNEPPLTHNRRKVLALRRPPQPRARRREPRAHVLPQHAPPQRQQRARDRDVRQRQGAAAGPQQRRGGGGGVGGGARELRLHRAQVRQDVRSRRLARL